MREETRQKVIGEGARHCDVFRSLTVHSNFPSLFPRLLYSDFSIIQEARNTNQKDELYLQFLNPLLYCFEFKPCFKSPFAFNSLQWSFRFSRLFFAIFNEISICFQLQHLNYTSSANFRNRNILSIFNPLLAQHSHLNHLLSLPSNSGPLSPSSGKHS